MRESGPTRRSRPSASLSELYRSCGDKVRAATAVPESLLLACKPIMEIAIAEVRTITRRSARRDVRVSLAPCPIHGPLPGPGCGQHLRHALPRYRVITAELYCWFLSIDRRWCAAPMLNFRN
jgi:hypothetical protein